MLSNHPLTGTSPPGPGVTGESDTGDGVLGVAGVDGGQKGAGVRGVGAGGPNSASADPVGVYGQGGTTDAGGSAGVFGIGGPALDRSAFIFGGAGVVGIGAGGGPQQRLSASGVYGQGGPGGVGVAALGYPGTSGVFTEATSPGYDEAAIYAIQHDPNGFAGAFDGDLGVSGNLNVSGAKSVVVPFADGTQRRLYCVESPECWFEDFGTEQLVNGQAEVRLDPGFASVVAADDYHVFLTEYEDNNGLYVTGRTSTGFAVRAKMLPNANGTFSYRVVAKRKDIAAPRFDQVTRPQPRSVDRAARRLGADRNP